MRSAYSFLNIELINSKNKNLKGENKILPKIRKNMSANKITDNDEAAAAPTPISKKGTLKKGCNITPDNDEGRREGRKLKSAMKTERNRNDHTNHKKVRFVFDVNEDESNNDDSEDDNEGRSNNEQEKKLTQLNLFGEETTKKASYFVPGYTKRNGVRVDGHWKAYGTSPRQKKRKVSRQSNDGDIRFYFNKK